MTFLWFKSIKVFSRLHYLHFLRFFFVFVSISTCYSMDLLNQPAINSALADKSITLSLFKSNNKVLAVGERGHILSWKSHSDWQQLPSPVSVTITDIVELNDGSKIAVGHDGIILKSDTLKSNTSTLSNSDNNVDSIQWQKVFNGTEILKLKIVQMKEQQQSLQNTLAQTQDDDLKEELEFSLEDLSFSIEDNEADLKTGPNKPLLSITKTTNDTLFACGAYGVLLMSKDKGETWQLISNRLDNPDNFHLNSVLSTDNGHIYIVGENGVAFKSDNGGDTWITMTLPYAGSLFGIVASQSTTSTSKNTSLVAFGLQGNIMASLDNGETWQHKKLPSGVSLLGGHFANDGKVYLVGHGGIIVKLSADNLTELTIIKHKSGAAFSDVLIHNNQLVLAGQFGITTAPLH